MAVKKTLSHNSDSCSNGKLITLSIPSFGTIHQFMLEFTNAGAPATLSNILSSISNISLTMNGEEYVNASPADIVKAYNFLGAQVGLPTLVNSIPLLIPHLMFKTPADEDSFAIGCDGFNWMNGAYQALTNIQVQIRCSASVSNVTDVKAYTVRTEKPLGQNITSITAKLLSYPQSFTTTGISEVDTLPRDSGNMARLWTMAIPDATGVIASGEALVNNQPIIQNVSISANDLAVGECGFAPVSGVFNYLFSDGASSVLSMRGVTDMRFKTNFSTAPTTGYTLLDCTVKQVKTA